METNTLEEAAAAIAHAGGWCVDISSPTSVGGATFFWCLVVATVTVALVTRSSESVTMARRMAWIVALIVCVGALIMVSAEAEREVATRFYMLANPRTTSVGIWNDFPRWPSALAAAVSAGVTLTGRKRKKAARTAA
jgi:hypothetical protein